MFIPETQCATVNFYNQSKMTCKQIKKNSKIISSTCFQSSNIVERALKKIIESPVRIFIAKRMFFSILLLCFRLFFKKSLSTRIPWSPFKLWSFARRRLSDGWNLPARWCFGSALYWPSGKESTISIMFFTTWGPVKWSLLPLTFLTKSSLTEFWFGRNECRVNGKEYIKQAHVHDHHMEVRRYSNGGFWW